MCWTSQDGDGWKMHAEEPLRAMSNAEVVGFVILVKSSMESSMTYRFNTEWEQVDDVVRGKIWKIGTVQIVV